MRAVDADELHVRPRRETGVLLDPRAEVAHVIALGFAPHHGVRIADRDRRELHVLSIHIQHLRLSDLDLPDIELHHSVATHERFDHAPADAQLDPLDV
jgi:hypothetical protein